jgi:hypothetical protein
MGGGNTCGVCGAKEDLMYAVVTSKPLKISLPEANNYHRLCEEHYESIIENTNYHVRELPPDETITELERFKDEEGYLVIYTENENPEKWFRVPQNIEVILKKNT